MVVEWDINGHIIGNSGMVNPMKLVISHSYMIHTYITIYIYLEIVVALIKRYMNGIYN